MSMEPGHSTGSAHRKHWPGTRPDPVKIADPVTRDPVPSLLCDPVAITGHIWASLAMGSSHNRALCKCPITNPSNTCAAFYLISTALSWAILNPFPQSELAQLSFINLSSRIVSKIPQVHCDFVLYFTVLMFQCFNVSCIIQHWAAIRNKPFFIFNW